MTNKCHSLNDLKTNIEYYGFRGEALASLRESCKVLVVISKHRGCDKTYSKVFRADKEIHSASVAVHNRMCNGTTVIVQDFLYNFPVRRARIQPAIELENIRHALLALSIINHQVSFTLRNDVTKTVILQTHEYANIGDALRHHCNIKEKHILIPVSVFIPPFKISANISRETEPSDHFQFIFVNKRLVTNKTMYKTINKKLARSFYLRNTGKCIDGKSAEKNYSIFVINIQCPHIEYDITYDPKKMRVEFRNWDIITRCLEQVVDKFVSTEDNLNFVKGVKNQETNLTFIKKSPVINNYTAVSNVLYGASKKRAHDTNAKGKSPIKKCSLKTTNNKKCLTQGEENNNNQKAVSSSAETILHIKQHSISHCKKLVNSMKSINKSTKLSSNCVVKSDLENPLPFKAPARKQCFMKRKLLSEHIITESESDPTPIKQKCIWNSTILKIDNNPKQTILPIISQDFFDNAVTDMRLTRNVLFSNSENYRNYDTLGQTLQINLYRSIKKLDCRKSLQLTQKESLNYLNNNRGVHSKCKQSTQSIVLTESSLKNVSNYLIKEDNLDKNIQLCNVKIQPKPNKNKLDSTKLHNKLKDKVITCNTNYCNLKQNWKLFTPTFNTQDTCKSYKALHIVRTKGSINTKSKVLMTMNKKSTRPDKKMKTTFEETGRIVNNSHKMVKNQSTQNTSTKALLRKPKQFINIPECNVKVSSKSNKLIESTVLEQSDCSSKTRLKDLRTQQIMKIGTGFDLSNFQKTAPSAQRINENSFKFLNNKSGETYLHNGEDKLLVSEKRKFGNEKFKSQQEIRGLRNIRCLKQVAEVTHGTETRDYNQDYSGNQIVCTNNKHFKDSNDPLKEQYVKKSCINSPFKTNQYSSGLLNNPSTIENCVQNTTLKDSVVVIDLTQYVNGVAGVTVKGDQEYRKQPLKSPICALSLELKQNPLNSKRSCIFNEEREDFEQSHLSDVKKITHLPEIIQQEDNKIMNDKKFAENIDRKSGREGEGEIIFIKEEGKIAVFENEQSNINFKNPSTYETKNKVSEFGSKIIHIAEEDKDFCLESNYNDSAGSHVKSNNISSIPEDIVLLSQFRKEITEVLSPVKNLEENSRTNLDKEINPFKALCNIAEGWNRETTPNGKRIYINSLTGMSSFSTPVLSENPHILSNRYWFMPKGISPLVHIIDKSNHDVEELSKNEKDTIHNIIASTNKTDSATSEINKSQIPERILHMLAGADYKENRNSSYQFNRPCVFSNESIQMGKVVGQIDNKFIAALLHPQGEKNSFLVLFDQHAVDERIRVEMLITGYKNNNGQLKSQTLSPSVEIFLAESEIAVLTELLPRLQKLGIKVIMKEGKIFVCEIPLCLFNKISKENQIDTMTALIKKLLVSAEDSRGVIPSLPHFIADIINTEACRGAIKFGDKISLEESKFLLSKLALCEMPFQCAHGRPVLTPLIEIEQIQSQDGPIHLLNLVHSYTSTHFDVIE
ncbi:DNA mismatch repair protein Mlh3-like isoform X3 [Homalodisca vitripennis]|nr:DNA mismatch repair protein Mlh3-like isoform X3 [Homalodisca vitripennis]